MARMYPQRLLDSVKSPAERDLYPLLAARLPADVIVFHNVRWLARSRAGGASDGETDFLIAHPEYGLLVIEVKGGTIRHDGATDRWTSTDRGGMTYDIDPFGQALRAYYSLRDKLGASPLTRPYHYPMGRGAWFPDVTVAKHDLALDIPREIVLDHTDMADPRAAILRLYAYWARPEVMTAYRGQREADRRAYGDAALEALIQLLAPTFEIRTPLGAALAREQEVTRKLTEDQFRLLDFLAGTRRACISGCAGSGKTFLAVEKARRLAREGYAVLLTCFNSPLAEWLRQQVPQSDQIRVCTFTWLCEDLAQQAHVALPPEGRRQGQDYFDRVLPHALLEAADRLPPTAHFDAIIVDEGQDFDASWWTPLQLLLRDPDDGILYIFYDDNQQLYARTLDLPIATPPYSLPDNCRNTQAIHQEVLRYYQGTLRPTCRGEPGRAVEVVPVSGQDGQGTSERDALRQVLHRLVAVEQVDPHQIIVLTPIKKQSQWMDGMRLGNCTLAWQLEPGGRNTIACATIHSFKGLERPVVILTELDKLHHEEAAALRYVATSRATNHLIVLEHVAAADASLPARTGDAGKDSA